MPNFVPPTAALPPQQQPAAPATPGLKQALAPPVLPQPGIMELFQMLSDQRAGGGQVPGLPPEAQLVQMIMQSQAQQTPEQAIQETSPLGLTIPGSL